MRKEFELSEEVFAALQKLPKKSDPQYLQSGGPIEHLAHTRDHLFELYVEHITGNLESLSLEDRSIPLSSMDVLYWEKCLGGFKRDLGNADTFNWAYLMGYPESPWSTVYDHGDNAYKWWQITKMEPFYKLGSYGLWCIETNTKFILEPTILRSDERSDFDLFFARTDEIRLLRMELDRFR